MKRVLGLDLGTNSIGWALVENNFEEKEGKIIGLGSRIIPMDQGILGKFGEGNSISQTADRTKYRSARRLRERQLLRRERLHRVLNVMNFLPTHYSTNIDFKNKLGQFKKNTEPKLAWRKSSEGKYDFIFKDSFKEMIEEFKSNGINTNIPYDWTLYYLRKKAINQKVSKEELAWIILNFNQKRGYYQLRGEEEEENKNKLVEFYSLKVIDVNKDDVSNKKGEAWYSMTLENGWVYKRSSKTDLSDWKGKIKDFIVTTDINDDGSIKTNKEGDEKRSFRAPKEDDWTLVKKKTEQEIKLSGKTVGQYIFDNLLKNPEIKIKGKLIRTIERKFYKAELEKILDTQIKLQPNLFNEEIYHASIRELYKSNASHQVELMKRGFKHLLINDIIFYQRPLKSQKSLIGNCTLEKRFFKDKEGNVQIQNLKVIPKSNPYYQEFRVWQWLYNLKIYTNENNKNVTESFIKNQKDLVKLFDFLMTKKEVNHIDLLKFFIEPAVKEKFPKAKPKAFKNELLKEIAKYRWNYVYDSDKNESKYYPMNETGYEIKRRLSKVIDVPKNFLTQEVELQLWHIIYSVIDKIEFKKALITFAKKHKLNEESFLDNFLKFKPFDSEYGKYSEKAIKKLLLLMRAEKYWEWERIDDKIKDRIDKIITGEYDKEIKNRVREKSINLTQKDHFQGLQLWLAQYIIYDRHSESENNDYWSTPNDIEEYLKEFKQHSLRNPIVEQVVTETLRVVKDIWKNYGNGGENYFDEIHVELGRDMKNSADSRKHLSDIISKNENTNIRIKTILNELLNDSSVENVRPYSPMQQEALKIYEDGILNSGIEIPDEIEKISKKSEPTKSEVQRYKLWLEQKYRSPYTGRPIPISKLFTSAYEIEHVIPQSRYFDDSFTNKVICEAEVNSLKDRQLGLEFIKNHFGQKVHTTFGEVEILSEGAYTDFVKENYQKNRNKRDKLLLEEIPEKMIERQLNDTRYISKFVSSLLSNLVRSTKNDEGINSKNLIPLNGKITNKLKHDWGLNDVWNELILPRFERLNKITNSNDYTSWNEKHQKFLPTVPLELARGFNKKRIDHRHHALDALVIACASRNHVNLLNNKHAKSKNERYDLQHKLRNTAVWIDDQGHKRTKFTTFKKPWNSYTSDSKSKLEEIIISFKQNLRVINKATNYYEKIIDNKKTKVKQDGLNWAIRKPMHKEMVYGKVDLPRIKVPKGKVLTAIRESLDPSFKTSRIESITDSGIQKILLNHLQTYDEPRFNFSGNKVSEQISKRKELIKNKQLKEHPELAFSPEGVQDMNNNITNLNDGKLHQPILKVRVFEVGSKFQVGYDGNKSRKYVEAAKGTNLFFAIYWDENKQKRNFETIPLNVVIERQKQGLSSVPEINERGHHLIFHLSPNDLVYVPDIDDIHSRKSIINSKNIYKMVSSTGSECHFIHANIAHLIKTYESKTKIGELGSLNKQELTLDNTIRIKEQCLKLKTNRLGEVLV
ncbi:type II CRISPR RNA-guided endonuclease Cas9 [Brumimicrobium salinarum]|uniref:CRISPR-associated endonuclease Cas9 n=1 Tax=Brumimicrobium salinarum TaxID=2058658 RepID=A0A2I0R2N9_9FLAO|nr:type II CRISPR RNA-guided endonuclease Cas9 [Brumimicrobium salinarum]PKR80853.1 type II CRISPR RNA-guided endonuclease Cas9 [Brumimicrobium salinarum]